MSVSSCLEDEIVKYARITIRNLGLKSVDEIRSLRGITSRRALAGDRSLIRRFKSRRLIKKTKGGYSLTGLGELALKLIDIEEGSLDSILSLYPGLNVRSACSKRLLVASFLALTSTLDLKRLHDIHGDAMLSIIARRALEALGLGAIIYVLAPPLSGDEAHDIVARMATLIGVNPVVVEECKNLLWKAIMRSSREEEAEIMRLLEEAIATVNQEVVTRVTMILGSLADYACTIAREKTGVMACSDLEELVEKLIATLEEKLRG